MKYETKKKTQAFFSPYLFQMPFGKTYPSTSSPVYHRPKPHCHS